MEVCVSFDWLRKVVLCVSLATDEFVGKRDSVVVVDVIVDVIVCCRLHQHVVNSAHY